SDNSRARSAVMSRPLTMTRPSSGWTRPMMWRSVTLFPVPLRPSRQNASPGGMSNDTSLRTVRPPKRFVTCSSRTAGATGVDAAGGSVIPSAPSRGHRRIEEEDDPHEQHVAQDDQNRRHDHAARRRVPDAFRAAAGREPEIARDDGNQESEHDGLERGGNE